MQSMDMRLPDTDKDIIFSIYDMEFVRVLRKLRGMQLIRTKENRVGFTIRRVKVGDVICVFNGAPLVHVLRRVEESRDGVERWRLVGDAFAFGLMYGEADEMDVEERDIVLV
jgi:hypothetical protein